MKGSIALINGNVYTGDAVLSGHAVLIQDGRIAEVAADFDAAQAGVPCVDLKGAVVAPGFIDAQVNGGGGELFNANPTLEALAVIAAAHERYGTLYWCPTVISSGMDVMERCLGAASEAMNMEIGILGVHLEGPYISRKKPGVHDKQFIRPADDREIDRLISHWGGKISLVTVAPEAVETRHIQRLKEAGIRIFLGHTNASCADAESAFAAGASGVTHLYNAMSQLTGREPGVVGAALNAADIWAGIIVDGIHVDWRSVRIAKEIKQSRLLLVTDAMPPVGKPDAVYYIGSEKVVCVDGCCATGGGTLAGSSLDMASAVRNCVTHCGIALDEALRMASAYPAEMLGVANRLGYIRPGYAADLVFLDNRMSVTGIARGGETRFFI